MKINFSDGMTIDTSGPLRVIHKKDGYYVVGQGILQVVATAHAGYDLIDSLKPPSERVTLPAPPPDNSELVRLANELDKILDQLSELHYEVGHAGAADHVMRVYTQQYTTAERALLSCKRILHRNSKSTIADESSLK